jgi:signal transduction histidine kinase
MTSAIRRQIGPLCPQSRLVTKQFEALLLERVRERNRIARELHDSMLQGFQSLIFRLQAVRNMLPERPQDAALALELELDRGDEAITDARAVVQDLRELTLPGGDLELALRSLSDELASPQMSFHVIVSGEPRTLSPLARDEIYRVAREALRNAAQHSNAQIIDTIIEYGDSDFSLGIRDDGSGIDPQILRLRQSAGHWGLEVMRERVEQLGGQLIVWSMPHVGTQVDLKIPGALAYPSD